MSIFLINSYRFDTIIIPTDDTTVWRGDIQNDAEVVYASDFWLHLRYSTGATDEFRRDWDTNVAGILPITAGYVYIKYYSGATDELRRDLPTSGIISSTSNWLHLRYSTGATDEFRRDWDTNESGLQNGLQNI